MNGTSFMKVYCLNKLSNYHFLLTTLLILWSQNSLAREFHSLEDISNTARKFVIEQMQTADENIEVVIGHLDQRLKLNQCDIPLEAYNPNYASNQGFRTVGVRCNDDRPWSLYVPVSVKNYKQVATLKHAVLRNTELTENDVVFEKVNINRLSAGYIEDFKVLKGKILTQNLSKGAILTKQLVKSPVAVKQGQMVTLIAKNAFVEVRMEGKAMSRGSVGDRIKVKNLKSKRIIEGVIIDKQLINVNL